MSKHRYFSPEGIALVAAQLLAGRLIEPHTIRETVSGAIALIDEALAQVEARCASEDAAEAQDAADAAKQLDPDPTE